MDGVEYTLHDSRVKALTVGGKPYFEVGDNINGSASFSVYPNHPYYDKVKKLTTDIIFYRDDEPEFYGRVLYDDEDFSGTKKVFVEGELAFLCDSIQRPKVYHNISVKAYVQDLIDIHNSQVEERKQFKQTITLGVRNLIRAFPLPLFMIDSILQGILLEYRNEAYMELASTVDDHKQKTEEYYEAKMKEMQESFEKEKADLIQAFENSEDAELEEEADQSEVVPADITVKEITEETEVD